MTVEPFSGGYVRTTLFLEPYADGPVVDIGLYEYLESILEADLDDSITVRVGLSPGPYFPIEGEAGIPPDVLAVPEGWVAELPAADFHEKQDVFVVRPGFQSILAGEIGPSMA